MIEGMNAGRRGTVVVMKSSIFINMDNIYQKWKSYASEAAPAGAIFVARAGRRLLTPAYNSIIPWSRRLIVSAGTRQVRPLCSDAGSIAKLGLLRAARSGVSPWESAVFGLAPWANSARTMAT